MQIYHYSSADGRPLGAGVADPSPLEPGAWLIPAFATATPPPEPPAGHYIVWEGSAWATMPSPPPPEPPPPPPPAPPPTLTARQLRLGLLGLGVRATDVDAAIAAIPDELARETALIEWEYSTHYERSHPLIAAIGSHLGLDAAQIDAAWTQAAQL